MRIVRILFLLFFYFQLFSIEVHAPCAILMNAENGRVIYEKNAHRSIFPASLTKVATAIYALERGIDFSKKIRVPKQALITISPREKYRNYQYPAYYLETDGSSFHLKEGEVISVRTLMHAFLIRSGNDCGNVLACHISGSFENFEEELNAYLKAIGCKNTYFCNPHGLHYPSHRSTAYDLAVLTKEALKNEMFRKIVNTRTYLAEKTNMHQSRVIKTYNALLDKESSFYYPYAIGVKTGYHSRAKYTLISAAKKRGRTLIAVLLQENDSKKRYEDAIKLFEEAFLEDVREDIFFKKGKIFEVKVEGASNSLKAYLKEDLKYRYYPSEKKEVFFYIKWGDLSLPIGKNSVVGRLCIKTEDGEIFFKDLYAQNSVNKNLLYRISGLFKKI